MHVAKDDVGFCGELGVCFVDDTDVSIVVLWFYDIDFVEETFDIFDFFVEFDDGSEGESF